MICRFCGEHGGPEHEKRCDGRQGSLEAIFELTPGPDLPLMVSGLTEETYATSEAAAVANNDSIRETQRARVLDEIHRAGRHGKTDDELQVDLGIDGSSERPRRRELEVLQRIVILRDAEGQAIKRPTRTNRRAVVWIDRRLLDEASR